MKCVEVEKQLDLLLDNEIALLKKKEIHQHFEHCDSCQKIYLSLQNLKKVSKKLPILLPNEIFDKQILQAFETYHQPQKQSFWKNFLIPIPVFATILTLFALGCGIAFVVGRMSVSQMASVKTENLPIQSEPKIERIIETNEPKIVTVTKYVKVPVIKEKEVFRFVQSKKLTSRNQDLSIEKIGLSHYPNRINAFVTKIDLEQFQPASELNIKVIKNGEKNEYK